MKRHREWTLLLLFIALSLALQSCSSSKTTNYKNVITVKNVSVGINNTLSFKGEFYFTLNRNLYMLDGKDTTHPKQLTTGLDVRDPAISPNGQYIAFVIRYTNYANLAYMPVTGGKPTIIANGNGSYYTSADGYEFNTYHWFAQPAWAPDNKHIIFLGDNQKDYWLQNEGYTGKYDSDVLDMQVYMAAISDRLTTSDQITGAQPVAYAAIGAGGLADPSYRPGHNDEAIYTSAQYTANSSNTEINIQLDLVNVNTIKNALTTGNTFEYHPGEYGALNSPGVPITPGDSDLSNLEPHFSPDGNTIVYVRRQTATSMGLYTMPVADGVTSDPANTNKALSDYSKSSQLLDGQYLSQPVWSPDGTQIAYYSYNNSSFDLWLATVIKDPTTGAYSIKKDSAVQLTQTNGSLDADSHPVWVS
jgi:dipeptidyl aminopeptidase/acylaminoacyl peptidase